MRGWRFYVGAIPACVMTGVGRRRRVPICCWLVWLLASTSPAVASDVAVVASTVVQAGSQPVRLQWDRNPASDNVTGYFVSYAEVPASTVACPAIPADEEVIPVDPPTSTTFSLTTLTPSRTYCLWAFAANTFGRSPRSNDVLTTGTPIPDTTAPTVPGSFTVGSVTATGLTLLWLASTDDRAVVGYRLTRNDVVIATTTTLTYLDTGLTPGTAYRYTVNALDATGNASLAAILTVTTPPQQPPTCTLNGKPYAIVIGNLSLPTKQVGPGQRGRVLFSLSNPFPVTKVQVLFGSQVVGELPINVQSGVVLDVRDGAGVNFSVPSTRGTYLVFVRAFDSQGCVSTTTTGLPLVVQ